MIKIKKKTKDVSAREQLQRISDIKEAIEFLNPDFDNEQVKTKLILTLSLVADPTLLKEVWQSINEQANKKVDEVTDLYCNFFSDDYQSNN